MSPHQQREPAKSDRTGFVITATIFAIFLAIVVLVALYRHR